MLETSHHFMDGARDDACWDLGRRAGWMTKIKRREERDFSEITTLRVEIYKFGMWIVL